MTAETRRTYTAPSHPALVWLTDPGGNVSAEVAVLLFAELFSSPRAVFAALLNSVVLNGVALVLQRDLLFAILLTLSVAVATLRWRSLENANRAARRGQRTRTDWCLLLTILWSALQGAIAFIVMLSGDPVLQVLSATTIMALIGPLCARNYAAPRLALLLISLGVLPFVAGAALSGHGWLWVLVAQTPLYLFGSMAIIARFQALSVATLTAHLESRRRARHDPLTGLLNRFGLAETLRMSAQAANPAAGACIVFCLDLDGFKQVNDSLGHLVGDRLLQGVAARLTAATRATDLVGRIGGDEFVVIAPGMPAAEGSRFADSLVRRIADERYLLEPGVTAGIGVSIGFACAPEDGTRIEDLRRLADSALYRVKAMGKGSHGRMAAGQQHILHAARG
jgi:diguanylate cyclase (GGDEF)-like protein